MFKFPELSKIKIPKLIIHSIILMVTLSFISLLSADIMTWRLGSSIEANKELVILILAVWFIFALQSKRYQKFDG